MANPSSAPVDATLELIGFDGSPTGLSTVITIPSGGQTARFLREYFPQLTGVFNGVLKVKSASPIVMTAVRETVNERREPIVTTTLPASEDTFTNPAVTFPLAISGGGYSTQFVLVGITPQQAISGNAWVLSSSGAPFEPN